MKLTFDYHGQTIALELTPAGQACAIEVNGVRYSAEITRASGGRLDIRLSSSHTQSAPVRLSVSQSADDSAFTAHVSTDGPKRWVTVHGRTYLFTKTISSRRAGGHTQHSAGELTAPMPGQVRAVNVSQGDPVTRGQTLLLLEAMKMEIRVQAPADGIIQSLHVKPGQTVERDQVLLILA